ncbi:hypothetical protein CkaCkLH20_03345 [Colletotrichum karsti]|uniref:Uncharacterized protein n=1 Tax=Colletotrichum karsti TaxID=1095194 RepID=A0A9P6IB65_9PEZI|nr:uncharacterized protein CkaCkLH20_03345 [Colletotrichum karsti]KAF9879112.1 hypothetical protein CkaCkLH20_03345 [Colletotrichum karsti]
MPASEFLTTQTMGGYLVVLALAGGLSYYYMAEKEKQNTSKGVKQYVEPRKENNAKKQRKAAFASQKTDDKGSSSAVSSSPSPWLSNDPDEKVDNNDFAKRMAAAKEGKKFDGKSSTSAKKQKQKSVKQSRAVEKDEKKVQVADEEPSAPAQAPAVEAVEEAEEAEESPATSPEVAPVDPSGVNDMLEPAAAGPSVLRLTGTDKEKPKPKNQKVPEKAETKKQRQNRQKAEAKKAAREEDEKERKVLLEKQLRTARIASGTPAKDGSQFMAAANGGKSAWTAGSPNGASTNGSSAVQPLDTFEAPANGTTAAAPAQVQASDSWMSSLPSEEEQMERLKEEDEWNTVSKKSSKKAKKEVQAPSPEPAAAAVAPAPAPAQSRPIAQAVQKPAASNGKAAKPAQSYGSFSALGEEEWDV